MTRQLPVLVVENDPFLRLLGVILDPEHTDPQRIAAFSDFFAHDLPDFNGWLSQLRGRLKKLYPATVHLVDDEEALHKRLPTADIAVIESLRIGAAELAIAPRLRAVQKYGAIASSIDEAACAARQVAVLKLRRRANIACAEHAIAMMLGSLEHRHSTSVAACVGKPMSAGRGGAVTAPGCGGTGQRPHRPGE